MARQPAKPKTNTPRCLLNPLTGRILTWTERLAERSDLVECTIDGVPLRPVAVRLARRAEADAEEARQKSERAAASTRDTFGAPANPVATADNSDLGDPE